MKKLQVKITIKQMALAGIMLALLTVTKYMDLVMPKTPLGYSWIEFYMVFAVVLVLVLPMPITLLVLVAAPFIWFALGQTSQQSPVSFFLDYSLPILFMMVIYLARFVKDKYAKQMLVTILIIVAFVLKQFSHTVSGMAAWDTPFVPSFTANAPMVFTTMILCIVTTLIILPKLDELQKLANNKGMSW